MTRPDDYLSSDYAAGGENVTSSELGKVESSSLKAAVKAGERAVKDLEDDSATYETRRPYRRVIKATVNP